MLAQNKHDIANEIELMNNYNQTRISLRSEILFIKTIFIMQIMTITLLNTVYHY